MFRTVAGAVLSAAQTQKALLVPFGLGQALLDDLTQSLALFDEMTAQAAAGRAAHIRTRVSLRDVLKEVVLTVKVVGDSIRHRFQNDPGVLAAWEGSSNIFGPDRSEEPAPEAPEAPTPPTPGDRAEPAA